ncbi:hypothetical protein [Simonsiella muelleri]|uniref:hypothetical protein n=1 Tax=Simonsiella muelleri TaxID=72 RepID=UPI0023F01031|nr:hypothetical protein [Simonsiella muelleri]
MLFWCLRSCACRSCSARCCCSRCAARSLNRACSLSVGGSLKCLGYWAAMPPQKNATQSHRIWVQSLGAEMGKKCANFLASAVARRIFISCLFLL